ncbi:MAG: phytanoyl-CoA dioxygenase family protein [Planctomycetes bacterium]|nr:phytanoyl-CoA dioxygenase family protein [Planctomycetota bacterium]
MSELPQRRSVEELAMPWVDSPLFERQLAAADLAPEQRAHVEAFARDGFLVIDPGLADFDALAGEIVDACERRPEYARRIQDGWESIEAVRTLACAPRVLELLAALYRRAPQPMQTLNFRTGTEQRTHSDTFHFHTVPANFMCGVWVALEDIDEDNGPLHYYPGSHRLPVLDYAHFGISGSEQRDYEYYALYEDAIGELVASLGLERRVLTCKKGTALVWHANLLHGGCPVRDPARTRHSQVTHYTFEGCLHWQPQRSDPFLGRIFWLHRRDVRTGRPIPHVYNGRERQPDGALRAWLRRTGLLGALRRLRG